MTGFISFVPAVLEHFLIAVSNTVMPATAPVQNAGRHINKSHVSFTGFSPSGQVPVLNPVGLICCSAETGLSVCLILRVVALEPDYLALTLKGKHMCSYTVE